MLQNKEIELLASFFPKLNEKTAKRIEIDTGFSHEPSFRLLKSLVKSKHLKEKKIGKTNVYEFIKTDEFYLIYTYYMTKKTEKFKQNHYLLYKRLREFCELINADAVILFGSYAKGTNIKKSDIDSLVVSNRKNIEKIALTFKTKYNLPIKPVVIKPNDFKNIKTHNAAFYNDLVEFGIVLDGLEFFFKEVYKNAKIV